VIKYKIYVLFLFLITIFSMDFVNADRKESLELFNKIIYIDPGYPS